MNKDTKMKNVVVRKAGGRKSDTKIPLTLEDMQRVAASFIKGEGIKLEKGIVKEDGKSYFAINTKCGRYFFDIDDINLGGRTELKPKLFDKEFIGTPRENTHKVGVYLDNESKFEVLVRGMFAIKARFALSTFKKNVSTHYSELSIALRAVLK